MTAENREILTLKVMRLSQPFIDAQPWPLLRIDEVVSDDRSLEGRIRQEAAVVDRALEGTHTLLLPSTQGYEGKSKTLRFGWVRRSPSTCEARYFCRHRCRRIFSGETFSAYINISNASNLQAVNVIVQVELSMGQKRDLLFDNSQDPIRYLNVGDSFDCTIMHQLTETGTYTLVCAVSHYLSALGEQKSFKKSFKFAAHPPFRIDHKVVHLPDAAFAECQLENVSQQAVYLSDASVFCVEGVNSVRLDSAGQLAKNRHMKGLHYFKPQDRYNLIFSFTPDSTRMAVGGEAYLRGLPSFGHLSLEWRTSSGGGGCLSDYLLSSAAQNTKPMSLKVVSCPASVQVETPFNVEVEAAVHTDQQGALVLSLHPPLLEPFVVQGPTTRALESLDMVTPSRYTLEVVCLSPGFHSLKGVSLYDPRSRQSTDASEALCQILAI
ncbi:c5orf44-like protein [Cystoisospora suis]|uniref:C5orf44-like protein n=1 Tax=Cystoisospora suis TaxID=483139 RepID=A0A2C6KYV1_9APIC|nr:c5orf44-like protein [Cystoisospora suis]